MSGANQSESLLLNLAIIKVNWDDQKDIVHNFMPIVGYAISQLSREVVSTEELKEKIQEVANFRIPTGALESLIRRASRSPYKYVEKKEHSYHRIKQNIPLDDFEKERQSVSESYDHLFNSFNRFCQESFSEDHSDAQIAFYDFLFEIAPHIANSATKFLNRKRLDELENSESLKYRAAKFILDALENHPELASCIDSFVKGAVLAESFYYSSADQVKSRFRNVEVFYDTKLLSQIIGYAPNAEVIKARELHEMVRACHARARVFDHNLTELVNIMSAAMMQRRYGPLTVKQPGDIFDYFNKTGASSSDIELEIGRLDRRLDRLKISSVGRPPFLESLGIDQKLLEETIREDINYISDQALSTDIESLSSIFRLRNGKSQRYLESCKAIFVTTNSALARASTRFFNSEYGVSDAPVCMADHVFCMLLWLKVADKRPNVPTDLMVATCVAALRPSAALWDRYIGEVERLKSRGNITEDDYVLLSHSIEARQALMDLTEGDVEGFVVGSAADVLEAAKAAFLAEKDSQLAQSAEAFRAQANRLSDGEGRIADARERVGFIIFLILSALIAGLLIYFGYSGSLDAAESIIAGRFALDRATISGLFFLFLIVISAMNLAFGWSFVKPIKRLAVKLASLIVR